jgi:hypothetical protein
MGKKTMIAVFILLALSAVIGFALSAFAWWPLIVACGVTLAVLSATVLQIEGFSTIPGIAIITACLTMNQVAYLVGLVRRGSHHSNIAAKSQQKQRAPFRFF